MRISLPHMGNLYIPFKALFERLDVDYVIPPATSQRTLSLGAKYSPEGLCIPFKLTTGNIIEAAESGADTILMPAGNGICRLGYYANIQQQILQDLGFNNVKIVKVGVSDDKLSGLFRTVKRLANNASWFDIISAFRFGLQKLNALDEAERSTQRMRAAEKVKGTANQVLAGAVKSIDAAKDNRELKAAKWDYACRFEGIPLDENAHPLVVGIIGEFYVLLEPFSNFDIETELGKLGVEVRRTTFVSEWTKFNFFLNPLGVDEKERLHRAAYPYLKRDIGGEGWESVGEKVMHHRQYDGIIHLSPFTCMPEIIASNIMLSTKENIPVLTVLCDEQMAKAGLITRLEAFVDLLARQRRTKYNDSKRKN
ncbi:MAG: acyl-CoA dehydratase activase-related protein [Dehalococcoidales bacterium]|nr:acyl-CoA dehydratase activase-related protein [Dehalococcoidales bacterium]